VCVHKDECLYIYINTCIYTIFLKKLSERKKRESGGICSKATTGQKGFDSGLSSLSRLCPEPAFAGGTDRRLTSHL
jgi:hypothetical protein